MSICLPSWLLAFAPLVVGMVLLALIVLMGVYFWRAGRDMGSDHHNGAESGLFIGLVILSVIAVVFFAAIAILNISGTCAGAASQRIVRNHTARLAVERVADSDGFASHSLSCYHMTIIVRIARCPPATQT